MSPVQTTRHTRGEVSAIQDVNPEYSKLPERGVVYGMYGS